MTRKPPTSFTPDQWQGVVDRYAGGDSITVIAADFGISSGTVTRRAQRAGLPPRDGTRGKLTTEQKASAKVRYDAGESAEAIGRSLGVSGAAIGVIIRRRGSVMRPPGFDRRTRQINDEAFSEITPQSAYWIGFLMADGCLRVNRNTVALTLATKDSSHLEKFRAFLGSTHKIMVKPPRAGPRPDSGAVSIEISSRKIVADLAAYGITAQKSLTAKVSLLEMNRDFWRGVIDGDGHLRINKTGPAISLCGSKFIVRQFLEFAQIIHPEISAQIRYHGRYCSITIGARRAYAVICAIYDEAEVWMDRKMSMAQDIVDKFQEPYKVRRRICK